jgi:hypothetical protein
MEQLFSDDEPWTVRMLPAVRTGCVGAVDSRIWATQHYREDVQGVEATAGWSGWTKKNFVGIGRVLGLCLMSSYSFCQACNA